MDYWIYEESFLHKDKPEENNIVGFIRDGRKTYYSSLVKKEDIIKLLITYRESFLDSLVDRAVEMWNI